MTTLKGGEGQFGGGGKALVEAQCRPLADGGYLLVIAGKSQARDEMWWSGCVQRLRFSKCQARDGFQQSIV